MPFDTSVHPGTIIMLRIVCGMMRGLDENIRAEYGSTSDQWGEFYEAQKQMELLVDSIPGAREAALRDVRETDLEDIAQRQLSLAVANYLKSRGETLSADETDFVVLPLVNGEQRAVPIGELLP